MNTALALEVQHPLEPACKESSTVKKALRVMAAALIVLAGVLVISRMGHAGYKDYISYWSAGKLLLQHGDPYAREQVFALEKAAGYLGDRPIIMRNPPWALFLATPLGWFSPESGVIWWTLAATGCIIAFLHLLKVARNDRVFAFFFAPALGAFRLGQSSPFLLLGLSLFLYFYRSRPWLAGASLLLMAIKPHLFLVFWVVLLADCIVRRNYRILGGLAVALAVANTFALLFNPHIWHVYFTMLRTSDLNNEFFPTSSMIFRLLISRNTTWLLFVPSAAAIVWGLWYYVRHRHSWNWKGHGMLVLLVAVMSSPYGWFTDEMVLLPALAFAVNLPVLSPSRRTRSMAMLAAIDGVALLIVLAGNFPVYSYAYMWTPIAWFAWFVYATWGFEGSRKNSPPSIHSEAQPERTLPSQEVLVSS